MSRPTPVPSRYTLYDRLLRLWDWLGSRVRNCDRGSGAHRARLGVEPMEDRTVPSATVWLSPSTQTVLEGSPGGVWVYRTGDTSQSLA